MRVIERELKGGVDPSRIAFVSFTKRAVEEARDRAAKRFGLDRRRLPYFRTIHSLCFYALGLTRDRVFSRRHVRALSNTLGLRLTGASSGDDPDGRDPLFHLTGLARAMRMTLREVWENSDGEIPWRTLEWFAAGLDRYKETFGLVDFADMLDDYVNDDAYSIAPVDVAIVDESQDLSCAQWCVVDKAFADCDRIYFAGDDDQAIYAWSGADVARFLAIKANETTRLEQSHRLPSNILALSQRLASTISRRYEKPLRPRSAGGRVEVGVSIEDVDLANGSWLLLARNRCFLETLASECERQGVTFVKNGRRSVREEDIVAVRAYERARGGGRMNETETALVRERLGASRKIRLEASERGSRLVSSDPLPIWHDAFDGLAPGRVAYYLAVLRAGRHLTVSPVVTVETIHSVKGGEADNVFVASDVTRATQRTFERATDDELRVLYVGLTRARKALFVGRPETSRNVFDVVRRCAD